MHLPILLVKLQHETFLEEIFDDRLLILGGNPEWPPRSPDLTPLDFFLWGYLKGKVFTTPCRNVMDLRRRIEVEVDILEAKSAPAPAGFCWHATPC